MDTIIEHLIEHGWNQLLPAIAERAPDLYPLAFWLHIAEVEELDAEQVKRFLCELVATRSI